MAFDASVILISHNRFEQTLLTLYSLMEQHIDFSKMEVVLVDDASTDQTCKLKDFEAPFHYQYIRTTENVGRSKAKNVGIEASAGKIIIFLDGEVMADPNFVQLHLLHHQNEENLVVAGTSGHHCAYTVLDPKLKDKEIHHFYSIVKNKPFLLKKWHLSPDDHNRNMEKIFRFLRNRRTPCILFNRRDVKNQLYKSVSFPFPSFPRKILCKFGRRLEGYHLAWMFCITRNASIPKKLLALAGPFNEEFEGWGYEDWEMGYRLYKLGAAFLEEPRLKTYHQQHPYSEEDRHWERLRNYHKFTELHPEIEVCSFVLKMAGKRNLLQINQMISEFYSLEDEPEEYPIFKNALLDFLKKEMEMLAGIQPENPVIEAAGRTEETRSMETAISAYKALHQTGKYPQLAETFKMLSHHVDP